MKTNVYIDGFNLYYAIKHTPYRWLNLGELCQQTLKGYSVNRIRYFTALVKPRPGNPYSPLRQNVYLRALRTVPRLEIHEGHFLTNERWLPFASTLASGIPPVPDVIELHKKTGIPMAKVIKVEEKGSDVNLATYLLLDGFRRDYEIAVIVSNDSDLVEPINVVRREFGLDVGVLNPHHNTSYALKRVASFYRPIRQGALKVSQFPETVMTPQGPVTKPEKW